MYKVIMVPTDGSGFDREAIRVALRIAERTDARVQLCVFSRLDPSSGWRGQLRARPSQPRS